MYRCEKSALKEAQRLQKSSTAVKRNSFVSSDSIALNKQYRCFTHLAFSVSLDHHADNNVTAAGGIPPIFYKSLYRTLP